MGALHPSTHLPLSSYSSISLRVFCKHIHRVQNIHFGECIQNIPK